MYRNSLKYFNILSIIDNRTTQLVIKRCGPPLALSGRSILIITSWATALITQIIKRRSFSNSLNFRLTNVAHYDSSLATPKPPRQVLPPLNHTSIRRNLHRSRRDCDVWFWIIKRGLEKRRRIEEILDSYGMIVKIDRRWIFNKHETIFEDPVTKLEILQGCK